MSVESRYFDVNIEDNSNVILPNRVSTLKLRITNKSGKSFKKIYVSPPRVFYDRDLVRGLINKLEVMWGGGHIDGYLLMLPGDRDVIEPGESVVAYFFLCYPLRQKLRLILPLYIHNKREIFGTVKVPVNISSFNFRGYIYRPRYKPVLREELVDEIKEIVENYGVPEIKTYVWQVLPRVHIYFDEREVATISGDIGSGIRHIFAIKIKNDLFVGKALDLEGRKRWYWVIRVWLFWLNKNIFDEVPDAERIELWINPDTQVVDWLITDKHWREVVFKGPVKMARVKITGGTFSHLDRIIRSYHPPTPVNMVEVNVSPDSRDPNADIQTIYDLP